jgi:predicted nucleic acid-binding protein
MIFLDTTVLVGAADARDECHADGKAILQAVAGGKPGAALVTDYVLDETLTILGKRRGIGASKAVAYVQRILSSPRIVRISIDAGDFDQALSLYARAGGALSFTDVVSLFVIQQQGCTIICSHDGGFDAIAAVKRQQSL